MTRTAGIQFVVIPPTAVAEAAEQGIAEAKKAAPEPENWVLNNDIQVSRRFEISKPRRI
jgi:hypothetical protein